MQSGQPERNFAPRTIWTGDNLDILRGLNSETVDLIYLDPPFNSNRTYSAPIGSKAAGAAFKDAWTLDDLDTAWLGLIADRHPAMYRVIEAAGVSHGDGMKAYLCMMAVRLLEMRRVLKPGGSIYLHCDPTASHYLKLLLDAVFGHVNFRNEIVWGYTGPASPRQRQFSRKHDTLFWYVKGGAAWTFNRDAIAVPHAGTKPDAVDRRPVHHGGFAAGLNTTESRTSYGQQGKIPETWWVQAPGNGFAIAPRQARQYVGFPTQKPLALLNRIIAASSNPGDLVLDPFCGCATACVAADNLQREWIGIDISPKAVELVHMRLRDTLGELYHAGMVTARTDIPQRTDIEAPIPYRLNKHVLFGQQEGLCAGCRTEFPYRAFEVDHVIPQSRGGTDHVDNLQLLCSSCNRIKGNRTMEYLMARLAEFRQTA